jgi:hypothetical protein
MRGKPMKTYIVVWTIKTRNGRWRDYRKAITTNNLSEYIKTNFTIGCLAFGSYKGMFRYAHEVEITQKFGYAYQNVKDGEYWFTKDTDLMCSKLKNHPETFYDYNLKGWI